MESILSFICEHAHHAHWILFILLLLTGFNIPISEDLIIIMAGTISSTCLTEGALHLYVWVYLGCWLSAWEAYWLGRILGPKLYNFPWLSHFITPARIEKLHHYYEKYGIFTFIIGRFFPGGVRNALFLTSGLGKMPFPLFMARDGIACLLSSGSLFYLGHVFGENYGLLSHYLKRSEFILSIIILTIIGIIITIYYKKTRKDND